MDRNLTILIAEDDEDYQFILERAIRDVGIANPLRMLRDGQQVIDYLAGSGDYANREANPFPSVMFLDLKMPGLNGLDVLRWIRNHPEHGVIPTMMLSSADLDRDVKVAYDLGAHAFFVKPPTLEELQQLLRYAYDFWRIAQKPPLP